MAVGRKTGGRQKGSKNKPKLPLVKQLAAERASARARAREHARAQAKLDEVTAQLQAAIDEEAKETLLDIVVKFARDESNPPGFRLEAAKAGLPYLHAKAPEAQPDRVVHITEIRHVIVEPKHSGADAGHPDGEGVSTAH